MAHPTDDRADPTVVIIDDDDDIRLMFHDLVSEDGRLRLIGSFPDATSGLSFVRKTPADAIVLDNHMRGMTGFSALPLLRRAQPQACIVLWSSGGVTTHEGLESGADLVLEKTVPAPVLLDRLVDCCDR